MKELNYIIQRIKQFKFFVKDLYIDRKLNISTQKYKIDLKTKNSFNNDSYFYDPLSYDEIFYFMSHFSLNQEDVVCDVGCGKGRIAITFGVYKKVKKIIGVDYVEELIKVAKINKYNIENKLQCPIEFFAADILNIDFDQFTIFLLFNPFGERTLTHFLEKLEISQKNINRKIRVVYFNCNKLTRDIFKKFSYLKFDDVVRGKGYNFNMVYSNY